MFFILSKVLFFLIQPLNWVLGLMLYSLLAKKAVRKKCSLLLAVVLGFFFTNHFIFNEVVCWWEVETVTMDEISTPYDIGILLGGYSNPHIRPTADRMNFSRSANRFLNAYELYRTGKIRKILLTGGSGSILQNHPSEAVDAREFLLEVGVPDVVEVAAQQAAEALQVDDAVLVVLGLLCLAVDAVAQDVKVDLVRDEPEADEVSVHAEDAVRRQRVVRVLLLAQAAHVLHDLVLALAGGCNSSSVIP